MHGCVLDIFASQGCSRRHHRRARTAWRAGATPFPPSSTIGVVSGTCEQSRNAPAHLTPSTDKVFDDVEFGLSSLQEDDEDDDTETPHSLASGGISSAPLQHYRSSRGFGDGSEVPLGRSPLRPTTSNAAGSMTLDGEKPDLAKSARVKVRVLRFAMYDSYFFHCIALVMTAWALWYSMVPQSTVSDLADDPTGCSVSWERMSTWPAYFASGWLASCRLMLAPVQAANEAELAAIRSRIEAALGAGVNEKRIADLLSLAQFQMLSRDARVVRSPTVVLSMRPQRSTTLRYALRASGVLYPLRMPAGHSHGQGRTSDVGVLMLEADRHCMLTY